MSYKSIAVQLFGNLADKYGESFIITKNSLLTANIKMPFRIYLSVLFLTAALVSIGTLIVLFILLKVLSVAQIPEIMQIVYIIFIPIIAAVLTFSVLIIYPSQVSIVRERNIETNMPFVLTHMGAIAQSGVPPQVIFRLVSQFDEYGDVAVEMRKIVKNIDDFGVDPLTAIKQTAERTPSTTLKQILLGLVTTIESGGDVKLFLKSTGEQTLFEWRIRREKFLQQLSAYAEFYTGLLIAAPLFIIALFAVMNMIQPNIGGFDILTLTKLSIYILVPFLNVGFLLFLRGVEVEM